VTLVNVYERRDASARGVMFRDWLKAERFACGRCQNPFTPQAEEIAEINEEDEIRCLWCAKPFLRSHEPVPGWNRAWSRL